MVKGLGIFRLYFGDFVDSYVIIGGTACDTLLESGGLTPRATRDIDMILVMEALNPDFVKRFWNFIFDGNYDNREKSSGNRKYYRFFRPENKEFPFQIEIFSRLPDGLDGNENARLTPIPVDDDISSLSAILMDEDYYRHTLRNVILQNGLPYANTEALICLKSKAFLDLSGQKESGRSIDEKKIRKHSSDVFRLLLLIPPDALFNVPESIKKDLKSFVDRVKNNLPGSALFKEIGVPDTDAQTLLNQFINNFNLK